MAAGMCLIAHRGDEKSPLLTLAERDLARAEEQIRLMRDRDPEGAGRLALDLTGMTESELTQVLDARSEDRRLREELGLGGER